MIIPVVPEKPTPVVHGATGLSQAAGQQTPSNAVGRASPTPARRPDHGRL